MIGRADATAVFAAGLVIFVAVAVAFSLTDPQVDSSGAARASSAMPADFRASAHLASLAELRQAFRGEAAIPAYVPQGVRLQAVYLRTSSGQNSSVVVLASRHVAEFSDADIVIKMHRPIAPRSREQLEASLAGPSQLTQVAGRWAKAIDERPPQPSVIYFWIGETYYQIFGRGVPLSTLIRIADSIQPAS